MTQTYAEVSTSFVKESGLTISRPSLSTTGEGKAVMIRLSPQQVDLNHQLVSIDSIEARINQLKAEQPELQVQLMSDGDTPVSRLVQVVDQVKAAKVQQLAVSHY